MLSINPYSPMVKDPSSAYSFAGVTSPLFSAKQRSRKSTKVQNRKEPELNFYWVREKDTFVPSESKKVSLKRMPIALQTAVSGFRATNANSSDKNIPITLDFFVQPEPKVKGKKRTYKFKVCGAHTGLTGEPKGDYHYESNPYHGLPALSTEYKRRLNEGLASVRQKYNTVIKYIAVSKNEAA